MDRCSQNKRIPSIRKPGIKSDSSSKLAYIPIVNDIISSCVTILATTTMCAREFFKYFLSGLSIGPTC